MLFVFLFVCRSLCMFLCQSPCLVWRSLFWKRSKSSHWHTLFRAVQQKSGLTVLLMNLPQSLPENSPVCFCSLDVTYLHTSTRPADHCVEWAWECVSVKHLVWRMLRPWVVQLLASSIVNFKTSCRDFKSNMIQIFFFALPLISHFANYLNYYRTDFYEIFCGWSWSLEDEFQRQATPWLLLFGST